MKHTSSFPVRRLPTLLILLLLSLSVSFMRRHRAARADLLEEFRLNLQVLRWGPGVQRGRGGGGDLQHCHHTQRFPQNQTSRIIEVNKNDLAQKERKWGREARDQKGATQIKGEGYRSIFSLCNLPPSLPECGFSPVALPGFCTPISLLLTETRLQGHRVYIR